VVERRLGHVLMLNEDLVAYGEAMDPIFLLPVGALVMVEERNASRARCRAMVRSSEASPMYARLISLRSQSS